MKFGGTVLRQQVRSGVKTQHSVFQNRFPSLFLVLAVQSGSNEMHLTRSRHSSMGWAGGILYIVSIPKISAHSSALEENGFINNVCETAIYKEKRKYVRSQSKQNFICEQSSYMFRQYMAIIRLNKGT